MRVKGVWVGLLVVLVLFVVSQGCNQEKSVLSYEVVGEILAGFHETAQPLCEDGMLKPGLCDELKKQYGIVREMYIDAGSILLSLVSIEDAKERELKTLEFNDLMKRINNIVFDVIDLLEKNGVKLEGK